MGKIISQVITFEMFLAELKKKERTSHYYYFKALTQILQELITSERTLTEPHIFLYIKYFKH